MALVRALLAACCLILVGAAPSRAIPVTFDDLDEVFDEPLASPYQGFEWENFRYFTFDFNGDGDDGFDRGVTSQKNAAYAGGVLDNADIAGKISRATTFDFIGASFGTAWQPTMTLTIVARRNNQLIDVQQVTVDGDGADPFLFNILNIDSLEIFGTDSATCGFNCSQFTMDDFLWAPATVTQGAPVPEPGTLSLLTLGGLAVLRRRRARTAA